MPESTITIDFPVRMSNEQTGFTYVSHDAMHVSVYATSMNSAKTKLRPALRETIDAALKQVAEWRQHFIGCASGDLLLIQFRHGNWGYEIAGPGRTYTSGICGHASYDDAVESARRHASDSYGGIVWEV